MSAGDFQTKYASFMESIVKSTVAETTKLFEGMVDELKEELSKVKMENEALKTTCRVKENAKTLAISESCQSDDIPEMCDTSIQCDLLSGHDLPDMVCQSMGQSRDDQNMQCDREQMVYILLKDHDYDASNDEYCQLTKPEVSEPPVISREMEWAVTDSASKYSRETETECPQIYQRCSYGSLRKSDDSSIQRSSEGVCKIQIHSVKSLAITSRTKEVASGSDQMLSEFATKGSPGPTTFKKQSIVPEVRIQKQPLGETPRNEHTYVAVLQYSKVPRPGEQQGEQTLLMTDIELNVPGKKNSRQRRQPSRKVKQLHNTKKKISVLRSNNDAGHDQEMSSICKGDTSLSGVPEVSPGMSVDAITIVSTAMRNRSLEDSENPNTGPQTVSVLAPLETGLSSESQPPCMEIKHGSSHAQSADIPSATLHGRTAASEQAPPCHVTESSTSATLQDAMLLVEAMDQSTKDCILPQEKIDQSTCMPLVALPSKVQSPVTTQASQPTLNINDQVAEAVPILEQSTNTYSNSQSQIGVQQHCTTPLNIITSPSSLTSTVAELFEQSSLSPPIGLVASEQNLVDSVPDEVIDLSKSSPCTIAPLSPNQISAVVSTVAAAQSKCSLSMGISEMETVTATTAASVVDPETTNDSIELKAHTKIKIIIPRPTSAVGTGQTQSSEAEDNFVGPDGDVNMSVSQLSNMCSISGMTSDGTEESLLTEQIPIIISPLSPTPPHCESLQITNPEQAETSSTEGVPISGFEMTQVVVKLKKLPLFTKTVLVSELDSYERLAEPDSISYAANAQALNPTPEVPAIPTSICHNLKDASVVEAVNESPMSEYISSCIIVEEEPDIVPSCSLSNVCEPVSMKSAIDFEKAKPSTVPDQTTKPSFNMTEEINNPEQKNPVTPKDLSDPRSQWTKTQFLAQLEVTPVNQDSQKVSTNEFADESRRKSERNSVVARLRSHLKIHLQAKKNKVNSQPLTGKRNTRGSQKIPTSENVVTTDLATKPISLSTKSPPELQTETEYSQASLKRQRNINTSPTENTTFTITPVCPESPIVTKDSPSPENTTTSTLVISPLPTPVSPKKPTLKNVATTALESTKQTPVSTEILPELQTEIGYSQARLKRPSSADTCPTENTAFKTVPVVSKDALSLENTTTNTLIIIPLQPDIEVNITNGNPTKHSLDNDSIKIGSTIEHIPINCTPQVIVEECANQNFESPVHSSSIKETNDLIETHMPPLNECKSAPCTDDAISEKSEDTNLIPVSGIAEDKPYVKETLPAKIIGKSSTNKAEISPKKSKGNVVCLRSRKSKDTTSLLKNKLSPQSRKKCITAQENARSKKSQKKSPQHARLAHKKAESSRPKSDCASSKKSNSSSVSLMKTSTRSKKSCSESLSSPSLAKEARTSKQSKRASGSLLGNTLSPSPKLAKKAHTSKQLKRKSGSLLGNTVPPSPNAAKEAHTSKQSKRTCGSLLGNTVSPGPNLAKEAHTSKQLKRKSSSLLENTVPPSVHWIKLPIIVSSSSKSRESAAKKSRLSQNCSISENVKLRTAQKLAKTKTVAEINKPKQSNSKKTKQVTKQYGSDETGTRAQIVWTPTGPATEATSVRGKRSSFSPTQIEERSSKPQNLTVVTSPSPSYHPILFKAPPIVSPLQPLAVIGDRLLKNQCGQCGRVLSNPAALASHVSLHTGYRPFSCDHCGKNFPDDKTLRRHDRVHRNGRIHVCHRCGKGFVYAFGLTKHLQMVHGKFKPYVCMFCEKAFFTKREVTDHIRIHTGEKPFPCHLCEKRFVRRVELNVHLRWHNGEKRFWCPFCGKGFLDCNNMKRHKMIHTGEKPHSCPHCPKNFTQSGHLKKHVRNVHKIQ
ncbi:mucin-17-like [Nerophis ophidion]|uniref:mucin-17-like n=1 Tax=Nerophis ophidion TaxID=159077 RepID=UPI002ADFCD0C|nr:mucin-17-like [Nerophis ophidion]